ncbi:MAG TPA: polyphosphate kinase 2 family protein [Myxococcota bacterium]|nr:polyphosphate kinase 2 family protein [Myxococcota bacterium]HRY92728.1 polyphosphate kinase 2 family protein [Myxococcota bacterium]HSA23487.1 polyphosphate kinase 2 family protein [Myxococcota bacterium]
MDFRKAFRVKPGRRLELAKLDTRFHAGLDEEAALELTRKHRKRLFDLQRALMAEDRRSVLVVLQAMDAAGKDGAIRKVLSGLNPAGCRVTSFRAPSAEELDHDFLWRVHKAAPARGEVGVFNRSHYEDVLIVRVHDLVPEKVWRKRYREINLFEEYLTRQGTTVVKIFLHISKAEQKRRFEERIATPKKHFKVNPHDFGERACWQDYMRAFEEVFQRCSTKQAPWYVIPADHKWFRDAAFAQILADTLADMKPRYPKGDFDPAELVIPD